MPAVTYTISAKDNTSRAAKSAQQNLAGIGEQAAKAAAGILSIEKARIGLQAIREVAQLGAEAFRAMAQNSAAMKGELGAVSSAMGKVAGSLGDTLANSRAFKSVLDTLTAGMKDLDGWIKGNAETINEVFAGAVRYAAEASRALLFTVKGLIDLIVVAKNMVPAAQESTSSLVEGTLHSMRFLGLKARMALTGESTVYRQAEAARLALQAYGAGEGKLGEALNQSESEVTRINAMLDAADALLDRVAKGTTDPRAGSRATRSAGGKAAAGGVDDGQKALLASQQQFNAAMIAMRAEATNDTNDIAAEGLRAEQAAAEASRKIQEQALADQRQINDEKIAESKRAAQEQAAILGALAASTATALAVALGSGESMIDALFTQIGGAIVQLGGTMTASGFAALLGGPAAALFGLNGPGMIAAGLGLSAAGAALQAGLIGGGGGSSSSGSGSTVASGGYRDTSSQRVTSAATSSPITYQITQNFSGVYTSEAEAGRKIQDALLAANRGGQSSIRRATARAY